MTCVTFVEIGFFRPMGFSDRWYVHTEDRGNAIRQVMSYYDSNNPQMMGCVNYINTAHKDFEEMEKGNIPEVPM